MAKRTPIGLKFAVVLTGLIAALAPAALLAYSGTGGDEASPIVAQQTETPTATATGTATGTATPTGTATAIPTGTATGTVTPPQTGNAGFGSDGVGVAAVGLLVALAAGTIMGGRLITAKRGR